MSIVDTTFPMKYPNDRQISPIDNESNILDIAFVFKLLRVLFVEIILLLFLRKLLVDEDVVVVPPLLPFDLVSMARVLASVAAPIAAAAAAESPLSR